jgi:hypothetical protein
MTYLDCKSAIHMTVTVTTKMKTMTMKKKIMRRTIIMMNKEQECQTMKVQEWKSKQ